MFHHIKNHLISLLTSLVVIINLGFWMLPIFFLALLRLLFGWIPMVRRVLNIPINAIYRIAAGTNSFWMIHIVGVPIPVVGELPDHPSPIVISNHQTWFDIPILHHVITGQGPTLKFLIKRQLVWVPIVGWLCWALGFPRLNRTGDSHSRQKDFAAIESATSSLTTDSGALLIFAEGTRFTDTKHDHQKSPYDNLLIPRPGGLKIALAALPADTPVLDVTINYHGGETNFWRCLYGANRKITVDIRQYQATDVHDPRQWLTARWHEKDQMLTRSET